MQSILPPSPDAQDDAASHRADYSPERRATALSWIRGQGLLDADVSDGAKLMAAVGLLICDDHGHIKQSHLETAMADPSVLQAAWSILKEARD
jgi:hypothetical protein